MGGNRNSLFVQSACSATSNSGPILCIIEVTAVIGFEQVIQSKLVNLNTRCCVKLFTYDGQSSAAVIGNCSYVKYMVHR